MKILLFEWLTGGGMWSDSAGLKSAGSLLSQGVQMVSAVGKDLSNFAEVDLLVDSRLSCPDSLQHELIADAAANLSELACVVNAHSVDNREHLQTQLRSLARTADGILVIAPETDGCLADSIRWLENEQHKLISTSLDFVIATSDKNLLASRLQQHGFDEMPVGMDLNSFLKITDQQQAAWFPIVVKPADGAGSEGVAFLETKTNLAEWLNKNASIEPNRFRAEQFVNGIPVSIAVVCGANQKLNFFPAMKQILHPELVGKYVRSEDSLSDFEKLRAKKLATRAIACLPTTTGFFGLDMVLCDDHSDHASANDVLIEVNPRITMSYLPLSQRLGEGQIARLMLERIIDR